MLDALPTGAPPSKAWQYAIPLGRRIFDFYPSRGDLTVSTDSTIPTALDGPIQVARYGTLAVNAALTAANRCRGLLIACDNLVLGAAAHIHMDGKGAAGSPKWAIQDVTIPSKITLSAKATAYADFLAWIRTTGYALFDPTLFAVPLPGMGDVQADYADWPASGPVLVSAAGCAVDTPVYAAAARDIYAPTAPAITGYAGTDAPGGGGSVGGSGPTAGNNTASLVIGAGGGKATVWSGGLGGWSAAVSGSGTYTKTLSKNHNDGSPYIVGNGVARPGGILIILVRNNVTVTTGHLISVKGLAAGYGGNGGGRAYIGYGGVLSGTLNMSAAGSSAGTSCGPGGAGSVIAKTFADMGWA